MQILKEIKIIDLSLYLTKSKTLIIADTHIGFEEALNKQGFMIPRLHFKELTIRLTNILKKVKPKTIVINGDIKHQFGKIGTQEWRNTLRLIDFLRKHCETLILIKGNHDKILEPIAKKRNLLIADNLIINQILITHGNKLIKELKNIRTIIIGHEHPSITIQEGARKEIFKCFLKGKYKRKDLIIMPSLKGTLGSDILKEKTLSPFLKKGIKNFEVFVMADKVYNFGKIKNFQNS